MTYKSMNKSWKWREWYSICSAHHPSLETQPDCPACCCGTWVHFPIITLSISSFVHKKYPKFWMWWMNERPHSPRNRMSKGIMYIDKKTGEKIQPFPNLGKGKNANAS